MNNIVDFYSKLPKGPAPPPSFGIKSRFFDGKNASGAPLVWTIAGIFIFGYTLDYNSTSHPVLTRLRRYSLILFLL
jgi:F-type H+-transporting ATPase subunit f